MKSLRLIAATCLGISAAVAAASAAGQSYPTRPIRIVTSSPGGGVDFAGRLIAADLSANLGQPVIVDNRGAAGGAIAAGIVAAAAPDGYTLLLYGSPIWLAPFLRDDVKYDPIKDFEPITITHRSPTILVVHPSLPVNSVRDLIALAKAKPGALNAAVGGIGTASHLATELFKSMAGINLTLVRYRGTGPALTALIAGEVRVMFANPAAAEPHAKSGRLRALAVTSAEPYAQAPELPTAAASGLPRYESTSIYGMLAPAHTPVSLIGRLNREIVRVLNQEDIKKTLFKSGVEIVGSSPAAFAAAIKREMATLGKLIKDARIRAN